MFSQYIGDINEFPALGSSSPQNLNSITTNKPTYTSVAAAQPKSPISLRTKDLNIKIPHKLYPTKKLSPSSSSSTKVQQKSHRTLRHSEPKGLVGSVTTIEQPLQSVHMKKDEDIKFNPSPPPAQNEKEEQYGLMGLLGVLRMINSDESMLALGSDLSNLGLNLNIPNELHSTFLSPWTDTQATPRGVFVEPGFCLPQCYQSVSASPPAFERMEAFSDETLIYIFYSTPMDRGQAAAGSELQRRNWKYNKELGLWITRGQHSSQPFKRPESGVLSEQGVFTLFDPEKWEKIEKDYRVQWDEMVDPSHEREERLPTSLL